MKLAEALIERAEIQKKNEQLIKRIQDNVKVQEGDSPAENYEALVAEYEENMKRFLELVQRISNTNNKTAFDDKMNISDAIARRDYIGSRIGAYRGIYESATIKFDRYNRHEVKFVRCIDVAELQDKINTLSKEYRELDTKLQGINWTIDLL